MCVNPIEKVRRRVFGSGEREREMKDFKEMKS